MVQSDLERKKEKEKKNCVCNNFITRELQRTNRKIGKTVTPYHRELLKERPSLGTFCNQSVIQGLILLAGHAIVHTVNC
jgi:hypothetical protein